MNMMGSTGASLPTRMKRGNDNSGDDDAAADASVADDDDK